MDIYFLIFLVLKYITVMSAFKKICSQHEILMPNHSLLLFPYISIRISLKYDKYAI